MKLIKVLECLPVNPITGICGNLIQLGIPQCGIDHLLTLGEAWPHHSGDHDYPIPESFDEVGNPEQVYNYHKCNASLWEGVQRKLRLSLCEFVADKLRGEL